MTTCRAHLMASALAFFDGVAATGAEPCEQAAKYRTRVGRGDDLAGVSVRAVLCEDHDRAARDDEGYQGSWTLRLPVTT